MRIDVEKEETATAKKKRKKVGRKLEYETVRELSKAVTEYFNNISYELPYTNEDGSPIRNLDGDEIVLVKYITPPSIQELCLHLRISMRTWENYGNRHDFADICNEAKLRIEAYLTEQVNLRDRPQGIIFNLENNFGWKKKTELELGEDTRDAMKLASMSIKEKQKLLSEMVPELTDFTEAGMQEEYDDENDGEH